MSVCSVRVQYPCAVPATSGSMSGEWRRSMAEIEGHPQTKGRATGENKLRPKPPRHSLTLRVPCSFGRAKLLLSRVGSLATADGLPRMRGFERNFEGTRLARRLALPGIQTRALTPQKSGGRSSC